MGLAAVDPPSHKMHTKFYKIPKFGASRPNIRQDTPIENIKIYKCMAIRTLCPDDQIFLCNFGIFKWLCLSQS